MGKRKSSGQDRDCTPRKAKKGPSFKDITDEVLIKVLEALGQDHPTEETSFLFEPFKASSHLSEDEISKGVCQLWDRILTSSILSLEMQSRGFLLCCLLLDIDLISPNGLWRNLIKGRGSLDYEATLQELLASLLDKGASLVAEVTRIEAFEGLSFLKALQKLTKTIYETSLPIHLTSSTVACVHSLLNISPLCIEGMLGELTTTLVFNIDHVDVSEFWTSLVHTYFKLRQVPKLVAKSLIFMAKSDFLKVRPLDSRFKEALAIAVEQLPCTQQLEIWKTLLFHLNKDAEASNNVQVFLQDLFNLFFSSACFLDHTVPKTTVEKVTHLVAQTQEAFQKIPNVAKDCHESFCQFLLAMTHFRDVDFSNYLNSLAPDLEEEMTLLRNVVLGKDLDNFSPTAKTIMSTSFFKNASKKCLQEVAIAILADENQNDHHSLIEDSREVQTALVIHVLEHLSDILDVDTTCEEIFKPFQKGCAFLYSPDSAEATKKLKKSFEALERSLSGDVQNPDLDPKFYFRKTQSALALLPLRYLHPRLKLSCLIIILTILTVSTDEDINDLFLLHLVTCLDQVGTDNHDLFKQLNCVKILNWLIRLRYITRYDLVDKANELISKGYVRQIREHKERWPDFEEKIDSLATSLKLDHNLSSIRAASAAIAFMEALEKPLTYMNASEEKLNLCKSAFDTFTRATLKGLISKRWNDDENRVLMIRAVNAMIAVWTSKEDYEFKMNGGQNKALNEFLDYVSKSVSICPWTQTLVKTVLRLPKDHQVFQLEHPANFRKSLWQLLDPNSMSMAQVLMETSSAKELTKNLSRLIKDLKGSHDCFQLVRISHCLVKANLEETAFEERRNVLQDLLPELLIEEQSNAFKLDQDCQRQLELRLLELEASLVSLPKPIVTRGTESFCFNHGILVKLDKLIQSDQPQTEHFFQVWKLIYEIVSSLFLHRVSTLVIPRIPSVLAVIKNLIHGLVAASNQRRKVSRPELRTLIEFSHNLNRLMERIRNEKIDFARVAPYLVADIIAAFQSVSLYPEVKRNLIFCIHKLLDICDKHSKEFLSSNLSGAAKEEFKLITEHYNQHFRYTGTV